MLFRSYICICLPAARLAELEIKMMVEDNEEKYRTAYTVTCDYKHGRSRLCRLPSSEAAS